MKKLRIILLLAAISVSGFFAEPGACAGDAGMFSYGAEVDYNSKYIWHGILYSDDPVLQPSVWVSALDFTFTVWNNFETAEKFNETDFSLGYSRQAGKFLLEPTLSMFTYYNQADGGSLLELSAKITHPLYKDFSVYTLQNFYFLGGDIGDSYFGGLGINFETALTGSLNFNATPFIGWGSSKYNHENFSAPETFYLNRWALNLFSFDAALEYTLPGGWNIKPHYTFAVISDKTFTKNNKNNSSVGAALGREF